MQLKGNNMNNLNPLFETLRIERDFSDPSKDIYLSHKLARRLPKRQKKTFSMDPMILASDYSQIMKKDGEAAARHFAKGQNIRGNIRKASGKFSRALHNW